MREIDEARFRRRGRGRHAEISEFDRWVSGNIADTFEYAKGWWD